MLKPVMDKHFITIILFLLCLLASSTAEARLTLGVVTGPDEAAGEVTSAQAKSLGSLLAVKLHEEVAVKELSDSATLIDWLDRFAMLDLALLPTKEVKTNIGRFLQIGSFDKQDRFNLVASQNVDGVLLQRLAKIVREPDSASWRATEVTTPSAKQSSEEIHPLAEPEPISIDEVIASQVELQHVPPLSPGRAWAPQEEGAYRDILPGDEPLTEKLVLGVFPEPGSLVRTSQQAEQLATYLEQALPVSVKVREFTRVDAFAEWFMRYRMVDLAVLSPAVAKANLGRDYLPVAKLFRTDKPGVESAELVVMRRGQNLEMQAPLQSALLNMVQTENGQSLMAAFKISEILAPEDVLAQSIVVDQEPEPVMVTEKPLFEQEEQAVEELLPPPVEYAAPIEPVAPIDVATVLPELPEITEPVTTLPMSQMPDVVVIPEFAVIPTEPVPPAVAEKVKVPDLLAPQSAPQPLDVPPALTIEVPVATPEYEEPVEPVIPSEIVANELPELPEVFEPDLQISGIEPTEITLPSIPEVPAIAAVPPMPHEEVGASLDEVSVVAEAPIAPIAPSAASLEDVLSIQAPEEPVAVVSPPVLIEMVRPESAAPQEVEQPEVATVETKKEPELVANEESFREEQQNVVEQVLTSADDMPVHELAEAAPVVIDEAIEAWSDEEFAAVLGEDMVAAVVARPDLPQELRLSGMPIVRPGRIARRTTVSEDDLLLASIPKPLKNIEPPRPPNLLPEPNPEPGVVYVLPFVAIMVPDEVYSRVFDRFIDALIQEGAALGLQFVILKGGLERVTPQWLSVRKYVTGEVYAYVEDSGCCSTDLRTKARLTYHRPDQDAPVFGFEYPVKSFFDHDRSSLDVERIKLSDDIAVTLSTELLKALQN